MSHSEYEYLTKDQKQKKDDIRIRRRRKRRKKQKKKEGEAGRRSLCQLMWKKRILECEIRNKICACELPRVMTLALQQPSAFERSLCYCEVFPGLQQPSYGGPVVQINFIIQNKTANEKTQQPIC